MKKFLGISAFSGFVFGVEASIFEFFLYALLNNSSNTNFVGVGTISGILFGTCIGFITRFLFRSNNISFLRHIINALILMATGLFLGIIAIFGFSKIPHGQWKKAVSPIEKPVQLLRYSTQRSIYDNSENVFYVQSESGNIFSYTCETFNWRKCNWNKVEALPNDSPQNASNCNQNRNGDLIEYLVTPFFFFRKITGSFEAIICDSLNFSHQANLVLLNDGTIWTMYRFAPDTVYQLIAPIFLLASSLLGYMSYVISLTWKRMSLAK